MTHKDVAITLDPDDAVIILKPDGTCEISLPRWQTSDVPDNILMGAALVCALQNQDLCHLIQDHFMKQSSRQEESSLWGSDSVH